MLLIPLSGAFVSSAQYPDSTNFKAKNNHNHQVSDSNAHALIPYQLKAGNYYVINNSLFFATKDTLVQLTDTTAVFFKKGTTKDEKDFFEGLKEKSESNKLTQSLYSAILRDKNKKIIPYVQSNKAFLPFKGKTIESIRIKKIDVYGPNVYDTLAIPNKVWEKQYNNIHFNTLDIRIKNSLLFKPGDRVDPFRLADNERILREYPSIQDARILIKVNPVDTNKVDLIVVTQDAMPVSIGGQLYSFDRGRLDLIHTNLFGVGHEQINRIYIDGSTTNKKGYHGLYKMNNIYKTFIDSKIEYYHVDQKEYFGGGVSRKFVTPEIKFAGGFNEYWFNDKPDYFYGDTTLSIPVKYQTTDFWLGRNFRINHHELYEGLRPGLNFSGRFLQKHFTQRPLTFADSNQYFYNSVQFLGKVGFSLQNFYKSNMIFSSGNTEDVPTGFLLEWTFGPEFNDYYNRFYSGLSFSTAKITSKQFYFYMRLSGGSYFTNGQPEQSVINCDFNTFSPLIKMRKNLFRQFIDIHLMRGFNRYPYETLRLTDDVTGLRSFSYIGAMGNYRASVKIESVYYPKFYYYGFGTTFFTFADIGSVGTQLRDFFHTPFYASIGGGFRIRNNNFVFNSLEIRLAWFPLIPEGKPLNFYMSSEQQLNLNNFTPGIPGVVEFK